MTPQAKVDVDGPPRPRSILVLEGLLTTGQIERMRDQLADAFEANSWPIILNNKGPVYWVPLDDRLAEFARFIVSLDDPADEAAAQARQRITLTQIIEMAREALGEQET